MPEAMFARMVEDFRTAGASSAAPRAGGADRAAQISAFVAAASE